MPTLRIVKNQSGTCKSKSGRPNAILGDWRADVLSAPKRPGPACHRPKKSVELYARGPRKEDGGAKAALAARPISTTPYSRAGARVPNEGTETAANWATGENSGLASRPTVPGVHRVGPMGHCVVTGGHRVSTAGHSVSMVRHSVATGGHCVIRGGHRVSAAGHRVKDVPAALVSYATSSRLGLAPFSRACFKVASNGPPSVCAANVQPPVIAALDTAAQRHTERRIIATLLILSLQSEPRPLTPAQRTRRGTRPHLPTLQRGESFLTLGHRGSTWESLTSSTILPSWQRRRFGGVFTHARIGREPAGR